MEFWKDSRSYYRDLIKQYGYSKEFGNLTSLLLSTSSSEIDPNQTMIEISKDRSKAKAENIEVCSHKSATKRSRKALSVANSRSPRQQKLGEWNLKTWWQSKKQSKSCDA